MQTFLKKLKSPTGLISCAGLIGMILLYITWMIRYPSYGTPARLSALLSAGLFTVLGLRFVPEWMRFWRFAPEAPAFQSARKAAHEEESRFICLKIFGALLVLDVLVLLAVFVLRRIIGYQESFVSGLTFWRCLDSNSYLNIAKNWYPTEGETVVQLVFLPGYPVAIRLIDWLIGNELYSGLIVAALCFAGSGVMLYRLARLDYSHDDALRAVKYLCILPGVFFFVAPMSDGLFMLLYLSCLYLCRTKRWVLGCLMGGLCSFTRLLGITVLVPLIMDMVHDVRSQPAGTPSQKKRWISQCLSMLLVFSGMIAYLIINYQISGDPFKFQVYQEQHWGPRLDVFFNTAAYQMDYLRNTFSSNINTFLGLWLPNTLSCFLSLILMIYAVKKTRASYIAWFIVYYVLSVGMTWLLSGPRYFMTMLTLPFAVAAFTKKPDADLVVTPLCILSSLIYLYAFVARWQVW